jgi:hypothetical protein
MKLSTMLLPTGEFILVFSEAKGGDPQRYRDGLDGIREHTGAAGVFVTDQSVEVEDALFDGAARRANELPGVWQDLGWLTEGSVFESITETDTEDAAEYIADYAKANRTVTITAPLSAGRAWFAPITEKNLTEEEHLLNPFTPGTRVEIIGPPVFNHGWAEWPGRFGVVRVPQEGRDIGVFVESEEIPDHSEDLIRWFFLPSSLQPVPATLEEAMNHFEGGN